MKNLFLLIVLAVLGYWIYIYSKHQTAEPEPTVVAEAPRKPVSMGVKKSVRALLEEWKSLTLSPTKGHVSKISPERELAEIRKDLFSRGIHSEVALREEIKKALLELGVAAHEVNEVSGALFNLGMSDDDISKTKRQSSSPN